MNLIDLMKSQGITFNKKGIEYWCKCPWHVDNDPSFSVSPSGDNYIFYCFSCKKGGNIVDYISFNEKISRKEALIIYKKMKGEDIEIDSDIELLTEIVENFIIDEHDFFKNRGPISPETLKKYKIGYCESFDEIAKKYKIDDSLRYRLGLPKNMDNCLIYPFFDYTGCFKVHIRPLSKIDRKYDTIQGKNWRHHLWGIEHVRGKEIHLVEGFNDVLYARDNNIEAAAMCGTVMHDEYWKILKYKGIEKVIFVPDGDNAGVEFLYKLVENYRDDFIIEIKELPVGDPDIAILENRFNLIKNKTVLQWYIDAKYRNIKELNQKIEMYKDISKYFVKLSAYDKRIIHDYFKDRFGNDDALYYLYYNIEPDYETEEIVLANCIYSNQVKLESMQILDIDCFNTKIHRDLFEFIRDKNNITPILVEQSFKINYSHRVDLVNFKHYLNKTIEISIKRKVFDIIDKAKSEILNNNSNSMIGDLVERLYIISSDLQDCVKDGSTATKNVIRKLSDKVKDPDVVGIPFNIEKFPTINRVLLGYIEHKFILLSGNTGHGKTTVICNWIDDLIYNKNIQTDFYSLEMNEEEIIQKQLAIQTGISGIKIMTGSLNQSEYDIIVESAKNMLSDRLNIIHGIYDLHKLISVMKSRILKYKTRIIFIDYLQLITIGGKIGKIDRWQQLMFITKTLKTQVCNKYNVTMIALSQLSKHSLRSNVPEAADQSGSYGMLADVDVAITIKKKPPKEIKDGSNFLFFIDKHRYNIDQILINAVFDKQIQLIKEI